MNSWPTEYPAKKIWEDLRRFSGRRQLAKEEQEKSTTLLERRAIHNCPQCGQFQGFLQGVPLEENQAEERSVWDKPYSLKGFEVVTKRKGTFMVKGKQKTTVFFTPSVREKIEDTYRSDNCKSQSEFIEKAVEFYLGYLNTKNAGAFLPEALSAIMTGTLDYYAGRIGSLLFKQGVDLHVLSQIIAYDTDIDEGEYQRLRGKAIRDMKRTNGRISFKDALDFQKSV
ncbi:MAG: hypothetical protein KHZ05_06115 [Oscillospiraceae bacterium]|nr:hypothetical protein [Oscillospiraceae bacterium]